MSNLYNRDANDANVEDTMQQLITEALSLPPKAIPYHVSQKLASIYPQKALLEGSNNYAFNVEAFARADLCAMFPGVYTHNQIDTSWNGMSNQLYQNIANGVLEVRWQGNKLDLLLMSWQEGGCQVEYYWILAETQEVAKNFFSSVCEWNTQIRSEVLVFDHSCWSKDPELLKSIKAATFDNLILKKELKQEIQNDIANFFNCRETYEKCRVPWKRGALFIGSPGNGKTHAIKALINLTHKPCLYVKSFNCSSYWGTPEENIQRVFKRARESAPCILVLEDLDSLIDEENRSFFLNELDGFASNHGILILATTNHPERIDPAISKRPSRFDRTYCFELPGLKERNDYLKHWNKQLHSSIRLPNAAIARIAELTDGFSFAYLKELCLSLTMRWMTPGTIRKDIFSLVNILKEQMSGD